ncbi:hypothetical protein CAEBREN_04381 [Caenorhabditis brenneri]|uniref:PAN-3 domain-containing protein n=1 Tax=Caenorhabditis brenneri TaxID=135651 RepID=G0NVM2_CAEBE|nr:hypothetical protein CAEBREN_04381 [Caenorhabditis brenneri]
MLRVVLFSLFFLPFFYGKQCRMMLIHGDVLGASEFSIEKMNIPMEECHALCYNTNECARHLQDDQCPDLSTPYYTSTDTWLGANNITVMLNKISKNGTQWSIHYSYLACDIRTQLFRRDNYWVCVGARAFDGCAVYTKAEELCKSIGMSLTAPYNFDEWQYFNASKGTYPGYTTALWADGRYGTYTDSTLIGNTFPTTKNNSMCPYIAFTPTVKMRHCDIPKEMSLCLHGAACLMKSWKIN